MEAEHAHREHESEPAGLDEFLFELQLDVDQLIVVTGVRSDFRLEDLEVEQGGVLDQLVPDELRVFQHGAGGYHRVLHRGQGRAVVTR